ncbi:unnamed protein product [Caenorhabditis sp. 36 PRJEB53466]|nr:unnamed protein product [Caenorhabditis sp. 36 PRJEB53466]
MRPFMIEKMPSLAWKAICEEMEFMDLLNLSLCSKNCKQNISWCRIKVNTFCFEANNKGHLTFNISTARFCAVISFRESTAIDVEDDYIVPLEINQIPLRLSFSSNRITNIRTANSLYFYSQNVFSEANAFISHLLELFPSPVKTVVLTPEDSEMMGVLLRFPSIQKAENLELNARKMKRNDVETLLGTLNSLKTIRLEEAENWFQMSFSLKYEEILVEGTQITAESINEFLKNWKESSDESLKYLEINLNEPVDERALLESLEVKRWDREKRNGHYLRKEGAVRNWENCENAFDLERPDGSLGSVTIRNRTVRFLVWTERFPFNRIEAQMLDPHFVHSHQLTSFSQLMNI